MSDLVAFLRARYYEWEAAALAWPEDVRTWKVVGAEVLVYAGGSRETVQAIDVSGREANWWEQIWVRRGLAAEAEFVALNDPSYVLADIAAKRQILDMHADPRHYCTPGPVDRDGYTWYEAGEKRWADIPCLHLRLLAAPFAGHPDFDPAWAVDAT